MKVLNGISAMAPENIAIPFTKGHRIYAPIVPYIKLFKTNASMSPRRPFSYPMGKSIIFTSKHLPL